MWVVKASNIHYLSTEQMIANLFKCKFTHKYFKQLNSLMSMGNQLDRGGVMITGELCWPKHFEGIVSIGVE